MINSILKKISSFFVLALLVTLINVISAGQNEARAACAWDPDAAAGVDKCSGTPAKQGDTACKDRDSEISCKTTGDVATANDNMLVDTLCNIFEIATGNGGKAFAAFAIISLGIGFFTGKVSWGLMIGVAAGIAAMFGAPTIVSAISGGEKYGCEEEAAV